MEDGILSIKSTCYEFNFQSSLVLLVPGCLLFARIEQLHGPLAPPSMPFLLNYLFHLLLLDNAFPSLVFGLFHPSSGDPASDLFGRCAELIQKSPKPYFPGYQCHCIEAVCIRIRSGLSIQVTGYQ
jgi:hypothetical protein